MAWTPSFGMYEKQAMGPAANLSYAVLGSSKLALLTHSWKAARTLAVWEAGM